MTETSRPPTTSYPALRARAIESLLIDKGYLTADAVDYVVDAYEHDIGPMHGARVVARAWVDPAFKERLLEDASEAARELGVGGFVGEHVVAVENTAEVHNVVVCTLCSCYPWPVLGLPPSWYKSPAYRSRVVLEPRAVLAEFGLELAERRRDPRLGLELRHALLRAAGAPPAPRAERGGARGARHARLDDRHGAPEQPRDRDRGGRRE